MKVLVVEDYEPLRRSISKAVQEIGWAVEGVGDGEEALWAVSNQVFDVMVLDLMLPKVSGLEVLQNIRAKQVLLPILVLTARDTVEDRMKGLDLGADDYLVKPFFTGELLARLKALLRRSYQQLNPVVKVGDLEVDTNTREVKRLGSEIHLTAREYALLEFLIRKKGQVVSRLEIWDHVYEYHAGSSSNVVDVYIGYLRKKLHLPGMDPLIHTKRGFGYLFQHE